ncbi:ferric reductase like transmembrane component-domain-containing protein [Microdochium trichocladiopsis]|uniref:Ferric reductase like transmembrane component-domain-containing protein n=1 Tax=Microdochium trichocladiopsis TaxID=1682393 RepID=A0A9P8YIX3_9PEZI|nr:ferric reductase like transmembrane component-domain-containing protein [Microdochium trichocladiopsis]KAH7041224.1 ferric reductase like transmembrane component-domain-containing protein [Microdochium trichocladiopsis]
MEQNESSWLLGVVGQVSRASQPGTSIGSVMSQLAPPAELPGSGPGGRPSPEQLAFIRRLVVYLLEGRALIQTYNAVLLVVLAIFTASHLTGVVRNRRQQARLEVASTADDSEDDRSSSSSSTLEGSASPSGSIQKPQSDIERQPLLGPRLRTKPIYRPVQLCNAWLMYQPQPIPLINRALPSNSTTTLVLAYLGLNVFYQCYHMPLDPGFLFIVADRAGLVFVANLPLLYLLAAKNQPLRRLTGYSYESLNILHRRVGELLCFEALVHGGCMIIWILWTAPGWLQERFSNFFNTWLVLLGLVALGAYELLFFTSLGSFRQRWYELFLASHVVLQIVALAALWLHQHNTRPFVGAALAIFVLDRLVWRSILKSATLKAVLTVLDDQETVLLSADWDIVGSPTSQPASWTQKLHQNNILRGWKPADHVFISVDELGLTPALQAHPFTVASAAPGEQAAVVTPESSEPPDANSARHAWFSLLIRAQTGFTSALLHHAQNHQTVNVRVDGPYGSQGPLHMLRACKTNILVAGGSGIAVIFPLAWSLATDGTNQKTSSAMAAGGRRKNNNNNRRKRNIHLLWIVHSESQRSWIPRERLDELRALGVDIALPEPTAVAGRPDVPRYVEEMTAAAAADVVAQDGEDVVGVVVSGPGGLNRSVRNACSAAVRDGRRVRLSVEKFGW